MVARESAKSVYIFTRALSGQSFFMAVTFPMFLHDQVGLKATILPLALCRTSIQ